MRKKTREVKIGNLKIGGFNPIRVQSMTKTETSNIEETVNQVRTLFISGCEIIRIAVRDEKAANSLKQIRKELKNIPLVADIHFNADYAVKAIESGFDKIRINPGNLRDKKGLERIVYASKANGTAIRIGVNSGSIEKELARKYGGSTPKAMSESALKFIHIIEAMGFGNLVVSLKSSDVITTIEANRLFSKNSDVPLHLGITEAGPPEYGIVKSAVGIGSLLLEGIGDTIRVSLSGDPTLEVKAGYDILKATGRRMISPEIISCPTCGRIEIDLIPIIKEMEEFIKNINVPMRIAIMGCPVNGPGEAKEADVALAGGKGVGFIYRKGKLIKRVEANKMVEALKEEVLKLAKEQDKRKE